MQTKQDIKNDSLAAECPQCGKLGKGLSRCVHCDEFIGLTLSKPRTPRTAALFDVSYEDRRMATFELCAELERENAELVAALEKVTEQLAGAYEGEESAADAYGVTADLAQARSALAKARQS